MTIGTTTSTFEDLTLGKGARLDQLVDRDALGELTKSFFELFRVPLRIFSEDGSLLADASTPEPLYQYLNTLKGTRKAVQDVVTAVKAIDPGADGEVSYACVTGAKYRIVSITFDNRQVGRMVLGPFLPPSVRELPRSLLDLDADLDRNKVRELLAEMPRAREETVSQVANHFRRTLDLILFSGHKALLTSKLHLASVRDSYNELQTKTQRLQEAYDRLKELDRLKSNFLATVSHELRTPLTSIIGYSEMLAEGIAGDLTEEQKEFVATIHEKGEQLLALIKGLLDLSKLESGTMSLRKATMDVAPLVNDVHQTLTPTARKKNVQLGCSVEGQLPLLWGDAERLRQILLNLVENAIKFTPPGGEVTIRAGTTMMDVVNDDEGAGRVLFGNRRLAIELRVADTGIGIPEQERERVFDAFYQVDSSSTREQGGTGLGLSIVKRLVESHDGSVHIESNPGGGTVFVVAIPCRRATVV
jgi:signal transduction histidine kinase